MTLASLIRSGWRQCYSNHSTVDTARLSLPILTTGSPVPCHDIMPGSVSLHRRVSRLLLPPDIVSGDGRMPCLARDAPLPCAELSGSWIATLRKTPLKLIGGRVNLTSTDPRSMLFQNAPKGNFHSNKLQNHPNKWNQETLLWGRFTSESPLCSHCSKSTIRTPSAVDINSELRVLVNFTRCA